MNALLDAFFLELKEIKNSTYLLSLVLFLPLISFSLLSVIFYKGVTQEMAIGVIDNDHSDVSRELIFALESSPTLHVKDVYPSIHAAKKEFIAAKNYALISIPSHFQKDIIKQKMPSISVHVNTQYILIGKIITAALSGVLLESATKMDVYKNLLQSDSMTKAIAHAHPFDINIRPFFNTHQNYIPFLVASLLPALWQIFIIITTIVSIGRVIKIKDSKWIKMFKASLFSTLVGKMLPYTIIYTLLGWLYLVLLFKMLPFHFAGDFSLMMVAIVMTTLAYQIIGYLLYSIEFDYAQALSLGAVFSAPAFAYMGITFPTYNMPSLALLVHTIFPISHMIKIQIALSNYAASLEQVASHFMAISAFYPLFIVVVYILKYQIRAKL